MLRIEKKLKQSVKGRYFSLTATQVSEGCIVVVDGKEMTVTKNTPFFAIKEVQTNTWRLFIYFYSFKPDITLFNWNTGYEKQL